MSSYKPGLASGHLSGLDLSLGTCLGVGHFPAYFWKKWARLVAFPYTSLMIRDDIIYILHYILISSLVILYSNF